MDVELITDKGRKQSFDIDLAQIVLNKSKSWSLPEGSKFSHEDGQLFKTPKAEKVIKERSRK